jgi:hypothetical protein
VWYHPEAGRFLTRDPVRGRITAPQSLNPYTYCFNNPLKYVDPDGRDPIFCDEEKDPESVIHGSYVPQQIESRDPDDMNDEEGLIAFWSTIIGMFLAPFVVVAMLLYAPAFFTWLSAGIAAHPTLAFIAGIVIGMVLQYIVTEYQLDEMKEELTQEECAEFLYALDEYMKDNGMNPGTNPVTTTIIYNEDGTITVIFTDQNENTSAQTFALVDGKYVPIPTPVESPTGSGTSSSENESSSTDRSGAPPIM